MKKVLLLFLLTVFSIQSFSQKKKPSEVSVLKNRVKVWFKEVYVPINFKDPYSYKLMSLDLYPISLEKYTQDAINSLKDDLLKIDTSKSYSEYQLAKINLSNSRSNKEHFLSKNDSLKVKEMDARISNYQSKVETLKSNYEVKSNQIKHLEEELNSLPTHIRKKAIRYSAYLDCYGRNGYGNLVLNKYYFDVEPNGDIGDIKSFD